MFLLPFYLASTYPSIVAASPVPEAATPSSACGSCTVGTGDVIHRSTLQLVWSCLAVIFASTWVCVHPNVPGYKTTWVQRLTARVKLSAVAIFAPEFIALYAFFQWRGCHQLYQEVEGKAKELDIRTSVHHFKPSHI